METADGSRQQPIADNRTLIFISIFLFNIETYNKHLNLLCFFDVFLFFYTTFIF